MVQLAGRISATSLAVAFFVFAAALATTSDASALQCGQRLVAVGDSVLHVRDVCGDPALVTQRSETRTVWQQGYGGGYAQSITILVDVWVYDFGPQRFMEELLIEGGIVRSMRSLGYGTRSRGALDRPGVRRDRALAVGRRRVLVRV